MRQRAIKPYWWLSLLWLFVAGCSAPLPERSPRILYLAGDAAGVQQLFLTDTTGAPPQALTAGTFNVVDYAAAPDGHAILLSVQRADGGSDLRRIAVAGNGVPDEPELLLACEQALCRLPVWAADNRRAVYERRTLEGSAPRLFWIDTLSGESLAVFSDPLILGYNARLSADGRYLSFVNIANDAEGEDLTQQQIVVYDFESGRQLQVPNAMNTVATWHPSQPVLLVSDLLLFGERFGVHLFRVSAADDSVVDLSTAAGPNFTAEDGSPTWSPDGGQIAFNRRTARTAMGSQIWLMAADGSDPQALTQDADLHHALLQFSPDGTLLLFQQFDITRAESLPAVGVLDMRTKTVQIVVQGASRPQWLP